MLVNLHSLLHPKRDRELIVFYSLLADPFLPLAGQGLLLLLTTPQATLMACFRTIRTGSCVVLRAGHDLAPACFEDGLLSKDKKEYGR